MPEIETPTCETPRAVPRRFTNQVATSAVFAMPPSKGHPQRDQQAEHQVELPELGDARKCEEARGHPVYAAAAGSVGGAPQRLQGLLRGPQGFLPAHGLHGLVIAPPTGT